MSGENQEPKGFYKSKDKAKEALNNPSRLSDILGRAGRILGKSPSNLQGFFSEIKALIRLVKAYSTGAYTDLSKTALILIVAGLIYLVNPLDLVPDFLIGVGFLDDATVIGFVLLKTRSEIQRFLDWELTQSKEH